MHVLIPAGGRGTRLKPLTNYQPKPLLPLGERPILTRILDTLPAEARVTILITRELEPDFMRWKATLPANRSVHLYIERSQPTGSTGPVRAVSDCVCDLGLDEDLVVLMGDSVPPFTLAEFLKSGTGLRPLVAAHRLPRLQDASRFGVIEIAPDGTLARFEEKPPAPRSRWVFTGCLYLPSRLLPSLSGIAATCPPQMGCLISGLLERGEQAEVFRVAGAWNDIGTWSAYLDAHAALLSHARRNSLRSQGNALGGVVYVHPSANVAGCELRDCVVYAGAQLRNAKLTGCVVQSGVAISDWTARGKFITPERELWLEGEQGVA